MVHFSSIFFFCCCFMVIHTFSCVVCVLCCCIIIIFIAYTGSNNHSFPKLNVNMNFDLIITKDISMSRGEEKKCSIKIVCFFLGSPPPLYSNSAVSMAARAC